MSESGLRLVAIPTQQDAVALLSDLIEDKLDASSIELDLTSAVWAKFNLKLTGELYDSTIHSDLMRALVEYQNTLYRIAAFIKNGKMNAAAIDEESRDRLRLNFKVRGGSSELVAESIRAIADLASKVTEGMGPKAKLTMVLSALLLLFGTFTLPSWLEHQTRDKEIAAQSEQHRDDLAAVRDVIASQSEAIRSMADGQRVLAQAIAQQPSLGEIQKQVDNAVSELMRQSADADSVEFQHLTLPGSVVRTLTGSKRRAGEDVTISGIFRVDAAEDAAGTDEFICRVKRVSDGVTIQARMRDAVMSENDKRIIQEAFWQRKPIQLVVSARKVGNEYKAAKIMSAGRTREAQN